MGLREFFFGSKSDKQPEKRAYDVNADLSGRDISGNSFLNVGDAVGTIRVNQQSALKLSAVWACVRLISNSIATLPVKIHQKGKDGNPIIAYNSQAHKLLLTPNEYMSGFTFRFVMIACKLLHGNGYARIVRDFNNSPIELIPIHPQTVEPKIENGKLIYEITQNGVKSYELPENMLHFKGISLDGLVGLSTIQVEAENLGIALGSQNEYKQFLAKGSKLDGFVAYPNKLENPAKTKSEQAFREKTGGTDGSTRVPILDNGAKFVQIGVNPAEAMWLTAMGYGVEDIARIFGAPPHKIGALRQSTNNNIEQQSMDYVNDCLLPHGKEFEEEYDRKMLSSFEQPDHYTNFNFNGLLRGDSQARAALYNSLFNNGGITPNQICQYEDLPTFKGGDEHYVQLNMMPVSKLEDYLLSQSQPKDTLKRAEIEDILEIIEKRNLTKV